MVVEGLEVVGDRPVSQPDPHVSSSGVSKAEVDPKQHPAVDDILP
jgi:hypothetical protein